MVVQLGLEGGGVGLELGDLLVIFFLGGFEATAEVVLLLLQSLE